MLKNPFFPKFIQYEFKDIYVFFNAKINILDSFMKIRKKWRNVPYVYGHFTDLLA